MSESQIDAKASWKKEEKNILMEIASLLFDEQLLTIEEKIRLQQRIGKE